MSLLTMTRNRHRGALASLTVTVYTREACCCCHTALEVVRSYQQSHGFRVEEVDATDPAIQQLVGPTVPVVAVDGKVRFRGEVNPVLFERLLAAAVARGQEPGETP